MLRSAGQVDGHARTRAAQASLSRPGGGRGDPWWLLWARRMLTWPLLLILTLLVWCALPGWLVLAVTADVLHGDLRRRPLTRTVTMFATYLGCELLGVVAAGAVWAGTLCADNPTRVRANAALQRAWSGALLGALTRIFNMRILVDGAEHGFPGPMLLMVRHSSTADTLLAAATVANPHRLVLRYVLKRELLWDPCLDLVGRRLPNVFVRRSGVQDSAQREEIAALAANLDERSGVLIYPEGTRFSARKRQAALEQLAAAGPADLAAVARDFSHVLPPRLGGPVRLLKEMRGVDVVFLDHCGLEGARTFAGLRRGALVGATIRVRLRRVPAREVPPDRLDLWLFQQWRETNAWVARNQGLGEP